MNDAEDIETLKDILNTYGLTRIEKETLEKTIKVVEESEKEIYYWKRDTLFYMKIAYGDEKFSKKQRLAFEKKYNELKDWFEEYKTSYERRHNNE